MRRNDCWFITFLLTGFLSGCFFIEATAQRNSSNNVYKSYQQPFIDSVSIYLDSARSLSDRSPAKAIEIVNRAIELSIRNKDRAHEATAFLILGNLQQQLEQHDLAIANFQKSINGSRGKSVGKKELKASSSSANPDLFEAYKQLAVSLLAVSRMKEAESSINNCLGSEFKAISESKKREAKRILADIMLKQGQQKAAISILEDVLEEEKKSGNEKGEIESQLAIGRANQQSGNEAAANKYYTAAKKSSDKIKDNDLSIQSNNSLANLYRAQGYTEKEVQARNDNISIKSLSNDKDAVSQEKREIANAYLNSNNVNSVELAEQYLQKGNEMEEADVREAAPQQLFSRSNNLELDADAFKRLAEGYLKKNDLKKASVYFEEYAKLQDSIREVRKNEFAAAIQLSTTMGKSQQRIDLLERERQLSNKSIEVLKQDRLLKEEEINSRNFIIIGLGIGMLFIASATLLSIRNSKAKRKADKLLTLQSLSGQMNPHFIFNALNSVNQYISRNDERAANRYLSGFSRLMRQVMDGSRQTFIPLNEEIEMLRLYMQLEHSRFEEKFSYTFDVAESLGDSEFVLPPMILQPYLENAVWHGLRYLDDPGKLEIRFGQEGDALLVTIADNGIGLGKSKEIKTQNQKKQASLGMQNIETRVGIMNELFKSGIRIELQETETGAIHPGVTVKIFIPQRTVNNVNSLNK